MPGEETVLALAQEFVLRPAPRKQSAYERVVELCRPVNNYYYDQLERCVRAARLGREGADLTLSHAKNAVKYANLCRQNIDYSLIKGTVPCPEVSVQAISIS